MPERPRPPGPCCRRRRAGAARSRRARIASSGLSRARLTVRTSGGRSSGCDGAGPPVLHHLAQHLAAAARRCPATSPASAAASPRASRSGGRRGRAGRGRTAPAAAGPRGAGAAAAARRSSGTAAAARPGRCSSAAASSVSATHSGAPRRRRRALLQSAGRARAAAARSSASDVPDHQAVGAVEHRRRGPTAASRGGGRRRRRRAPRTARRAAAQLHRAQQRQLADARLALRPPATRPSGRPSPPAGRRAATAGRSRPGPGRGIRGVARSAGARAARRAGSSFTWTTTPGGRAALAAPGGSTSAPSRPWAARPTDRAGASPASASVACAEQGGLVGRVEHRAGVVVQHHHVVGRRRTRSRRCGGRRAGTPAAAPARWAPASASSAWRICSAVVLASVISSGPASLRQQVRSTAPTVLPGDRVVDRHAGAGEVLQVLGVVLVAEDVRRAADLQRGADAVGADELLGVAEAGRQLDAVQVPLELAVAGQPGQHQAGRVGEDDADRLALELLAQAAAAPARRCGSAGCPGRGRGCRACSIWSAATLQSRDRHQDARMVLAHRAGLERLGGQEALAGLAATRPSAGGRARWSGVGAAIATCVSAATLRPPGVTATSPRRRRDAASIAFERRHRSS